MPILVQSERQGSPGIGLHQEVLSEDSACRTVIDLFQSVQDPRNGDWGTDRQICGRLGVCPYLVSQDSRPTITLPLSRLPFEHDFLE